jgi:hypothetical protein
MGKFNRSFIRNQEKRSIGLGIDHLWFLIPLAAFGFILILMPVPPNDLWWHLKIGELIHTSGTIPTTNIFAWTLPVETPFTYGAWLGEYLLYSVYWMGRFPLLVFSNTLLLLLTFALVGYAARQRSGSWRIAGLALILAAGMSFNNTAIRPQMLAFLPFMGFSVLLDAFVKRQVGKRWLLLLPLTMLFWVNVHGTFILGFILMGITLAGEGLRVLIKQPEALAWRSLGWLGTILLLCLAAMLVNPQCWQIFGYVYNLMTDQPSQGLIMEWQTPAPQGLPAVLFYFSILLLMASWALSAKRPTPTELLLVLAFTWLAWNGVRYVIWYGMVAMPVLAGAIKDLLGERKWLAPAPRNLLNLVLGILLFVPLLLVQPWWIGRMPLPESYRERVLLDTPEGPLLTVQTPVGAAEYLRQNPGGKLFNEMGYGSYLIWALPEQGVFIDPRVELYPYEMWQDYIRITRGARYNELLAAYGADRLLLDRELQAELITALEGDAGWEREYEDAYAQVWRKVEGE